MPTPPKLEAATANQRLAGKSQIQRSDSEDKPPFEQILQHRTERAEPTKTNETKRQERPAGKKLSTNARNKSKVDQSQGTETPKPTDQTNPSFGVDSDAQVEEAAADIDESSIGSDEEPTIEQAHSIDAETPVTESVITVVAQNKIRV